MVPRMVPRGGRLNGSWGCRYSRVGFSRMGCWGRDVLVFSVSGGCCVAVMGLGWLRRCCIAVMCLCWLGCY